MKRFEQTYEIPSRTITVEKVLPNDFAFIKEVMIDSRTAEILVEKGKPVYTKRIETNGIVRQLFFVKVSSKHYIEFFENNII